MQINISQGLSWLKTLKESHKSYERLRDENSHKSTRLFGESKEIVTNPTYNVKKLNRVVNELAKEIRNLDDLIKTQNAKTVIEGYEKNESVLGDLEELEVKE